MPRGGAVEIKASLWVGRPALPRGTAYFPPLRAAAAAAAGIEATRAAGGAPSVRPLQEYHSKGADHGR